MHKVIRVMVYAEDPEDAMAKAKEILDQLTENQQPYDYYCTFDDENTIVSGKARWGELPVAAKYDSDEGKKLVDEGWKFTEEAFMNSIEKVRLGLNKFTYEELMDERSRELDEDLRPVYDELVVMFRYTCDSIGYSHYDVWLYDQDGEHIRTPHHLKNVLTKWACLKKKDDEDDKPGLPQPDPDYDGLDIWVVPADVHY